MISFLTTDIDVTFDHRWNDGENTKNYAQSWGHKVRQLAFQFSVLQQSLVYKLREHGPYFSQKYFFVGE